MNEKSFENPKYSGPGLWYHIHKSAYDAVSEEKEDFAIKTIKTIINNLSCQSCKLHAQNYLKNNDIEKYRNSYHRKEKHGLFIWTVTFHNMVNKRLGNPIMSLKSAKLLYSRDELCENTCDAGKYSF